MISGRKTLNSIESGIQDIQNSINELQGELKKANDKKAKLLEKRIKLFHELAEVRIKDALSDGVIDETDNLSHQVRALLEAREKTITSLKEQYKSSDGRRSSLLKEHSKLLENIETYEKQLDQFAGQAQKELKKDEDYLKAFSEVEQAEDIYKHAQEKNKQAELNRERKGAPYQADPLFMYLWKRKYGTKSYDTYNFIEWLDDKVAHLVNYNEARANYAVLLEIPERLNDHLKRLKTEIKAKQDVLAGFKAQKIAELAGEDLQSQLKTAREKENEENLELEKISAEMNDITAQMNVFSEGRDHSLKKAVELSVEFLEEDDFSDLLYEARQTHDAADDRILTNLKNIDSELDHLRDMVEDHREDLNRYFKRKQELLRLSSDFRRSHYDDPRSVFTPDSNMDWLLQELLKGAITAGEYWVRSQRHHRWRSRPADPYRHSSNLPPFGGGWGRGRSRDHDFDFNDDFDFGDDDFMTGDRF